MRTRLESQPNSVGSLSASLRASGRAVPSTLSMPQQTVGLSRSDAVVALRPPLCVTMEAPRTASRTIARAAERAAATWHAQVADLGAHRLHRIGRALERGGGRSAGERAACQEGFWGCEPCQALHALVHRGPPRQRNASGALAQESEAAEQGAHAQSAAKLHKRRKP